MLQPQHVIEISDDDDDDAPEIEESEWKKKLFASLNAIQAEPKLVSFKSYQEFVNPGLKIGGQQIIPLPLTDHYADIIKELSHSVQGTENKAQNVWELDRAQFDLINPAWRSCLDRIAQEITKELDIENALLSPKRLTLQGPGPVAEQDLRLEQSDHIVGHISVCLPSEHQGGDIGVSLGGRRKTVSTAASSALDLSAIGWISPAHSLATELVSGYRLTISYIVHRFNNGQSTVPSSYVGSGRVEEVLQMWQRRHFGTKKILYKLDDKNDTGVLSLREARDRNKAVCEALSMACSEAGLYMLFAEITHEVTDDLTCKTVESSINGLFTPEGQYLAENKELDAENEVLGFDVDRQWDLEPASDDDEGMSNEYLMEEHEMTRGWHDHAVLLIPKEGLLDLVRPDGSQNTSRRPGQPTRDQEAHHPGVAPVVAMVVDDLEKNPAGAIKVAENIIDKLCDSGNDTQVLCTCINPIVNWCLRSGYMPLYTTAFRKTPITVVHVLAEYLASKYEGTEDSINWKEWLHEITKKPIKQLGILYRDFSQTILAVSPPVWKSFDEWSETIMDEKLNTELNWEYKDLEMILDLMRLRCDSTQWIVNRLEPAEEAWLVETPRHDLICGPFVRLITECHAIGAFVEACKIIEDTFSLFLAEKARWILVKDPFGVIYCLITPLIRLAADGLSRKIPALLDTLELLVRKIIRLDLPRQSQPGGGLVFRERGCGFCEDCAELDRFLTSPQETVWDFNAPKTRRLHIEHAIGVQKSLEALRILDQTTGTCEKLKVTKREAQAEPDLRSWGFNYNGLKRVLQPLRGDFMRKALGEQRYHEIILLEGFLDKINRLFAPPKYYHKVNKEPRPARADESDHTMSDSSEEGSESYSVDEYAESKQALSRTLDSIRSTSEIGTLYIYSEDANPGLVIGGDRPIRLPLDEENARAIMSICQRVPSEHRNRIVVDTTTPAQGYWRDTAKGLGMFELRADPRRLLYEPGSFFQTHSDSEREQDIIGTLAIPNNGVSGLISECALELENMQNFLKCFSQNFQSHGVDIS
ncbi:hypothetical protein FNAPI_12969 [Fusarium napiforme]|uniref:Uncharacterized protein n=1 Tax=Fusarium napiforme TaxID=42672 RepID=A0A8H5MKG3_9HYPO|nr:hypothetical protein FNAPI_12969 [Fusarium napiforme]